MTPSFIASAGTAAPAWRLSGCLVLAMLAPLAHGQSYERDGLPCVVEVCLGDTIDRLANIPWQPALSPRSSPDRPMPAATRSVTPQEHANAQSRFPGSPGAATAYLVDARFDKAALAPLGRVKAACQHHRLQGSYSSAEGNLTHVGLQMVPEGDNLAEQRWRVSYIHRVIPSAVTTAQRDEAQQILKERYAAFDFMRRPQPEGAKRARFMIVSNSSWGYSLNLLGDGDVSLRLRQHPACGGGGGVRAKLD